MHSFRRRRLNRRKKKKDTAQVLPAPVAAWDIEEGKDAHTPASPEGKAKEAPIPEKDAVKQAADGMERDAFGEDSR